MNKALFLDRDGIINVDHGYVYKMSDFEFVEGIFELCQKAQQLNYKIIIITNQSGIARGYYTESDFNQLTTWMKAEFLKNKIVITDVFYCPHHPTSDISKYKKQCACRKPEPELITQAKEKYNIDLSKSIFVGDKESDMQAAQNANINKRILVASNYGLQSEVATIITTSVQEVVEKIT